MGKANLIIAISGSYNGKALQKAREDLEKMNIKAASEMGGIAGAFANAGAKAAEMGGKIHNAGEKMDSAGTKLTAGLTTPIVAAGAAAFNTANDYEKSMSRISSALGTSKEEAARFRDIGATIYKEGWGESLDEVTSALLETKSTIRDIDDTGLEKVTKNALVLKDTFEADVNETIRGTNALIEGFGLSADEACDLMAAGMQRGLNYTDELGDNLSEYSVRWGEAGMSASQYFSLLEAGTSKGAYNLDKVGDFLNEFLTSLSDGRLEENIDMFGQGSKDAFNAFREGEATAEDVLNAVIADLKGMTNETERATAASETWSSLGEDNAMGIILSLGNVQDSYSDVASAAQQAGDAASDSFAAKSKAAMRELLDSIEPLGQPLLDMATDIAGSISEFAKWFDALDDGTKRTVLEVGKILAIAGPVLTIGGKITKGIGNITVGAGKLMQKTSALIVSAKNAKKSMGDTAVSVDKVATSTEKAGKTAKTSTKQISAMGDGAKTAGAKAKSAAGGIDKATTSMGKAGKAAGALKGFLGGLGANLAAALIVQGVIAINGEIERAKEKTEKLDKATKGLSDTMGGYYSSLNSVSTAMQEGGSAQDGYTSKITNLRGAIDGMIESNAELADSVGSIFSEASASINEIDYYRDAIDKYAGKCLTSSSDVAELELAVKNLNDVMGTNYSVVKSEDGTYQIMADGARVAKDEILKLIDAQKLQIQLEANSEAWKEAYKGIKEQAALATQATKEYSEAVAYSDELRERVIAGDTEAIALQKDAVDAVQRTKQAMDEANGSYKAKLDLVNKLEDAQILYQQAMDNGADSIEAFISSNDMLMATLETVDQSALGFTADLKDLGLTQADLKRIGEENMPALASIYDGSVASIKEKLSEFGIKLDETKLKSKETAESMEGHIASFGDSLKSRFDTTGVDIDSFCADLANAGVSTADFQMLTHEQLGYLAEHYDGAVGNIQPLLDKFISRNREAGKTSGRELCENLLTGVESMRDRVSNKTRSISDDAKRGLGSSDATSTGKNFVQGFLNGTGRVNVWNALFGLGKTALSAIQRALKINSPSKEAAWIGEMFGAGLIKGMGSTERGIVAEARSMSRAMELSPSDYSYSLGNANSSSVGSVGVGSRTFNVNLTVNVNTANRAEASLIGQTLGEQLYTELARRERACA